MKDLTGVVADRAEMLLEKVMQKVHERIFLGPGNELLSPQQALRRWERMSPEERLAMTSRMGRDELMSQLEELNARQ